jgi:hypothetical protein
MLLATITSTNRVLLVMDGLLHLAACPDLPLPLSRRNWQKEVGLLRQKQHIR